jgi:hypothetical protein
VAPAFSVGKPLARPSAEDCADTPGSFCGPEDQANTSRSSTALGRIKDRLIRGIPFGQEIRPSLLVS